MGQEGGPGWEGPEGPRGIVPVLFPRLLPSSSSSSSSSMLLLLLLLLFSTKTSNKGLCGPGCDLEMSTFDQTWGLAPWNSPPLKRAVSGDGIPGWGGSGVSHEMETIMPPAGCPGLVPTCSQDVWARALGPGRCSATISAPPPPSWAILGKPAHISGLPGPHP